MKKLIAILILGLAGCNSSPPIDPNVQALLTTGEKLVVTVQKCVDHMKSANNADIPECNSTVENDAYVRAKMKVTTPGIPAVQAMDEKLKALQMEGMSLVFKLSR